MDKRGIIQAVAAELGLTRIQVGQVVQKTFDAVVEGLVEDGRVELRNFGVFAVRRRKPRTGRNPRNGAEVVVPERSAVVFKAGQRTQELVGR